MPDLPSIAAGSILACLILYALLGGADFGGGVWHLLGRGERAHMHRKLIASAIGPVWETNHIWVLIAVVVLFTGFPVGFAVISTALFVPVSLMLAGVVLRGAAFAFHSYHLHEDEKRTWWGGLFAGASLATPFFLGTIIGAVSSGTLPAEASSIGASTAWIAPFPVSAGLLAIALFSHLAAVYLIFETDDPSLKEDFRIRALLSSVGVAALLVLAALLAHDGAPDFYQALLGNDWSAGLVFLAATAALGAHVGLLLRNYPLARICAAAQAVSVIVGWGAAQYPFIVRPDLSIPYAASPAAMLRLILIALAAGALFLFPGIFVLFRVFKKEVLFGRSAKP